MVIPQLSYFDTRFTRNSSLNPTLYLYLYLYLYPYPYPYPSPSLEAHPLSLTLALRRCALVYMLQEWKAPTAAAYFALANICVGMSAVRTFYALVCTVGTSLYVLVCTVGVSLYALVCTVGASL